MTQYFPIIVEQESNGTFSAWVAGLPGVYAAADTVTAAKRGIRSALAAHLAALASALARSGPLLLSRSDPASDQDLRSRSEIGMG